MKKLFLITLVSVAFSSSAWAVCNCEDTSVYTPFHTATDPETGEELTPIEVDPETGEAVNIITSIFGTL